MKQILVLQGAVHVDTNAIAKQTGLTVKWVRVLASRSTIPSVRIGNKYWFRADLVKQALATAYKQPEIGNDGDILDGI